MAGKTMIRAWRQYRGLTQEQLANRVGISVPSLSRVERGKQPYNQGMLEAIAEALNCEPADLLSTRQPGAPEFALLRVLNGMSPSQRTRALRVVQALADDEAA